ncbi:MAG: hypothetical protein AB1916_16340 [Thermodesulfobacteriota bacterium]
MSRQRKHLLVLGDSASVSIGGLCRNYVDLFPVRCSYDHPLLVLNASSIGTCAPDALAVLRDVVAEERVDAAVVYVGNCDASAYGPAKASRFASGLARAMGKSVAAPRPDWVPRRNRFCHYDPAPWLPSGRSVTPQDYGKFLAELGRECAKRSIPLFAFNPAANSRFPPGNNCGNFLCYSLLDARCGFTFHGPAESPLLEALGLDAAGRSGPAGDAYARIAAAPGDPEAGLIASNNLAVLRWAGGRQEEAVRLFEDAAAAGSPMSSIPAYNRALAALVRGEADMAERWFSRAMEDDLGSYRATEAYRESLVRALGGAHRGAAAVLDLKECLAPGAFIDYCHPDQDGHAAIFGWLEPRLRTLLGLGPGPHRPEIRQLPANPDRSLGHSGDFFTHYGLAVRPDPTWYRALLTEAGSAPYAEILRQADGVVPDAELRKRLALLSHPVFGLPAFLESSQPTAWTDQGRVPELYFLRHMLSLYRLLAEQPERLDGFPRCRGIVLRPELLDRWLPERLTGAAPDLNRLAQAGAGLDPNLVADRILTLLAHMLSHEPSLHVRVRTITWWFFKESIIFGTPSHPSLLHRRLDVLKALDSCLVMRHALSSTPERAGAFGDLLGLLERVLEMHERRLAPVCRNVFAMAGQDMDDYRAEAAELLRQVMKMKQGMSP